MKKLLLVLHLLAITFGAIAQNDTTRYTMVNGYGFTYNRLKAKAALVMPTDTVTNKLPGSVVVLNDTLYVRRANRWEPVSGGGAGIPSGGTTGQILAKDSDTSFDVSWIDNYTEDVRETVKASQSINKGQAVYVSGADGANVIVSKASNAAEMTSSKTLGLLYQDLATNGTGFVIISGRLSGLNTSGAVAGDPVWLGTNGNLLYGIANKPVAPAHMVYLGVVTRVNANNGEIFVHVQNGFEIEELHNVLITDSVNNQLLAYDSTSRLWKNKTIATVLGYTPVKTTDTASMLAPYLRKADTATLSNRINLKLNIADTAAMLAPFARDTGVVHKAGTETIIGAKTFTQPIAVNTPVLGSQLKFTSTGTYGIGVQAGQLQMIVPSTTQKISLGYGTSDAFTSVLDVRDSDIVAYRKLRVLNMIQSEIDTQNWADPSASGGTGQIFSYFPNATNNFGQGIAAVAGTKYDAWYQVGALNGGGFRFYRGTTELMRVTDSTKIASLAGSGTRMVVTNSTGVLSAQSIPSTDSTIFSTRAWRQKGDDSLAALITAKPGGTGTTNYVTKWTGTSTIGPSQIFDEGTNVGINTTTPGSRLDVYSSGYNIIRSTGGNGGYFDSYNASGTRLASFGAETNGDTYVGARGNTPMMFLTNNAERMRIFANGRVGINTGATDAGYQFDVNGTGRINGQFTAVSDFSSFTGDGLYGSTALPSMITTPNGGRIYFGYASSGDGNYWGRIGTLNGVNKVSFGAIGAGVFNIATGFNNTERMRVDSNGNTGIGITDPSSYSAAANRLVVGNLSAQSGITIRTPTNGDGSLFFADGTTGDEAYRGYLQYIHASDALRLGTSGIERMRIFNNGRILVGSSAVDAGYQFDVSGSIRNTADAYLSTASGNVFVGATTAAISNGLKYIYNEAGNGSGIGPELILHNTVAQDAASMAVSFTGVRSGAGVASQIRSTRRGVLTFHTQDLPSATPNTPAERMRIDALGNVGIGINAPNKRVSVLVPFANNGDIGTLVSGQTGSTTVSEITQIVENTSTGATSLGFSTYTANLSLSEKVRITNAGNVGIGTQSPSVKLDVASGHVKISDGFSYMWGAASTSINGSSASNFIDLYTNSTAKVRVNSSGNVGIGTLNPVQKLVVSNGGAEGLEIIPDGIANTNIIQSYNRATSAYNSLVTRASSYNVQIGTTSAMQIDASGNVGVGAAPLNRLHIEFSNATAYTPSNTLTAPPIAYFYNSSSADAAVASTIRLDAGNLTGNNATSISAVRTGNADAALTFGTRSAGSSVTERMRIFANGRVGINTTTDAGYQLDVNGNTRVTGKIDVTANTSIGHNIIRTGTSDIAAQVFNSNGWLLYGAEGANGGAIFTGSTPYAAVVGSGYNRPLQLATNNTVRMEIDSVGLVGINTVTPTERLDVNGRARIRTVDSTATATNMLYVDNNGVVKKTAVPGTSVAYSTGEATIASGSGFTFVKDSATGTNHHFLNKIEDVNTGDATVTMQIAVYKTTSTFTTGGWVSIATIPGAYAPQTTVIYELPGYASGATYYTSGSAQFSGAAEYTGTKVVRIDPSGNVDVRIGTVSASATQGGTNYVIIPIAVTWVLNPTPL